MLHTFVPARVVRNARAWQLRLIRRRRVAETSRPLCRFLGCDEDAVLLERGRALCALHHSYVHEHVHDLQ